MARDQHASNKPSDKSLHIQLEQLNERSRMYAVRLWAIPFLYVAVIGIVLSQIEKKEDSELHDIFPLGLCLLGIFVFGIMIGTRRANDIAVQWIRRTEESLGLPVTVRVRHGLIDWSHYLVVLGGVGINSYLATQQLNWVWLRLLITLALIFGGIIVAGLNRVQNVE